jgi:hypothetical protein
MVKKTDFVPVQDLAGNFVRVPKENITMVVEEKKKRGRPKKYSTPEEARKAKIANTIKGAKKRKGDGIKEIRQLKNRTGLENLQHRLNPEDIDLLIHGNHEEPHSNIPLKELRRLLREQHERGNYNNEVEPLKSIYNELTKRGYGIFFDTIKKVQGKALQAVQAVKNYANVVVNGRNDYPPKVRAILDKEGDKIITGVCLNRTPLGKPLMTALQVASGNTFSQKLSNTEYDKLFHLFACIYLGGSSVVIEKNEVINAESSCKKPAGTESKDITSSDIPAGLTLNQALNKTKERMGGKFFTYSAKDNNCQDFIVAFLQANNIGNETDVAWVKQETKVLFEGNNRLRKIANTLTDIGAKVNEITTGAGAKKKGGMVNNNDPGLKIMKALSNPIFNQYFTTTQERTQVRDYIVGLNQLEAGADQGVVRQVIRNNWGNLGQFSSNPNYPIIPPLTAEEIRRTARNEDITETKRPQPTGQFKKQQEQQSIKSAYKVKQKGGKRKAEEEADEEEDDNEDFAVPADYIPEVFKKNPFEDDEDDFNPDNIGVGYGLGYDSDSSSSSSSSSEYGYGINDIDFEDMKWGSFSIQLKQYNKTHSPKLDLHSFAMMILANPKKFNKKTSKRARFYINVILKKGKGRVGYGFTQPPIHIFESDDTTKGGMINDGNVTPPALVPLTQPQGNSILNAFALHTPQARLNALQTAVNNIGNDGGFVRGRFETWVSGFSNPQQVLGYMRTYDAIFAWEQDQATDVESVDSEDGFGLKKGRGGKQSKIAPAEKTSKVAPLPRIEEDDELTQEYIRRSNQKAKTRKENRLMANEDKPTPEAVLRDILQKTIKSKKELSKIGDGIKKSNSNIKMPNKWISYVKEYAKTHNLKYNEALKDPKMKAGYKKSGGGMPTQSDEIIAQNYDQKNLGANGKVDLAKYLN